MSRSVARLGRRGRWATAAAARGVAVASNQVLQLTGTDMPVSRGFKLLEAVWQLSFLVVRGRKMKVIFRLYERRLLRLFEPYVGADGHQQYVEQLVKSASEWDAFKSPLPFWLWRFFYTKQELERRGQVVGVGAARRRLACSKVTKNGVRRRPSIEGAGREHINPHRIRRERMTI